MPSFTVSYTTEAERQAYERAIAYAAEMHALGVNAPDGSVLDACEGFALTKGRDFLRDSLAGAARARVELVEKKSNPTAVVARGTRGGGRVRS